MTTHFSFAGAPACDPGILLATFTRPSLNPAAVDCEACQQTAVFARARADQALSDVDQGANDHAQRIDGIDAQLVSVFASLGTELRAAEVLVSLSETPSETRSAARDGIRALRDTLDDVEAAVLAAAHPADPPVDPTAPAA